MDFHDILIVLISNTFERFARFGYPSKSVIATVISRPPIFMLWMNLIFCRCHGKLSNIPPPSLRAAVTKTPNAFAGSWKSPARKQRLFTSELAGVLTLADISSVYS